MPPGLHRASGTAAEKLAALDAWRECGNTNVVMAAFYSDLDEIVASEIISELASFSLVDGRIGMVADEHDTIDELLE
ncbi:hypothetical protein DVH05_010513 [Phytophthora capsici]|nr:hypothetical protein DVH05_010513 [Phytophthora capsici]